MKALIIEDDPDTRKLLGAFVRERRHEAVLASSAEEALERCTREAFSLILLDLGLPGMDGLTFCSLLRAQPGGDRVFIMVVTARDTPADALAALEVGADDYVSKPIDPAILRLRLMIAERQVLRIRERGKAEDALKESSTRLARTEAFSSIIVTHVGLEGQWLKVPSSLSQLLGYSEHELKGRRFEDFTHPEDSDTSAAARDQVIRGELKAIDFETRYLKRDGGIVWLSVNMALVTDSAERPVHFLTYLRDVTSAKRLEQALRESEERYAFAVRGSSAGLWDWNLLTGEVYYSPRYLELLGCAPEDLSTGIDAFLRRLHPDDRPIRDRALQEHLNHHVPLQVEYRLRHADGTYRWFESRGQAIWNAEGRPIRIAGSILDITERKDAEEALRVGDARNRAILSAIPDVIFVLDGECIYRDYSTPDPARLGGTPERFLGRSIDEVHDLGVARDVRAAVARALETGDPQVFDYVMPVDGSERSFEAKLVAFGPDRVLVLTRDVTDRRRMAQDLRRTSEHFATIINSVDSIVWEAQANPLRFTFVSEQGERFLGYPQQRWIDEPGFFEQHIHPEDRAAAVAFSEAETAGVRSHEFEYRMIAADGRVIWVRNIVSVEGKDGIPERLNGVMVDMTAKKEAERSLRESEERHRSVIDTLAEGVLLLDDEGIIRAVNPSAERILMQTSEELLGHPAYASKWLITREDGSPISDDDMPGRMTLRTGEPQTNLVMGIERPEGPTTWIAVNSRIMCSGEDTGKRQVVLSFEDITERKQAEEALRRSERRAFDFLDGVPVGVFVTDADGHPQYLNREAAHILGRGLVLGASPESLAETYQVYLEGTEEQYPPSRMPIVRALAGESSSVEDMVVRRLGVEIPLHVSASPVRDDAGNVAFSIATFADVSKTRQAQAALIQTGRQLEEQRKLLDEIVSNTPGHIVLYDAQGRHLYVNRPALEACRRHLADVVGKYWHEIPSFPSERGREIDLRLSQAIAAGEPIQFETTYPIQGEMRTWACTFVPIRDLDGHIAYVLAADLDITDRKRAEVERESMERRLQETQKLESLGVLAGGIAHDFNNLLTGILGNASLAKMDAIPGTGIDTAVQQIEQAAQRAADLCRQMLAYSGKGRFVVQRLDLSALVTDTTHLLQLSISKHAVLKFQLTQGLPPVLADGTQIRQIIMNLVMNASDAIGERSGLITISTGVMQANREFLKHTHLAPDLPEGEYVFLEVTDTGCGMSVETLNRIFDPFFTTKFTGRGLGLAAVLGIVRGHRGALKVESTPSRGSTFRLLLPCAEGAAEHWNSGRGASETWRGSGKVLVVDDEATVRTVANRMLEALGYDVLTAEDGRAAMDVFRGQAGSIRIVLLDLTMPHWNGEETFRALRQTDPAIKVILMSGYSEHEAVQRFVGQGLAGFVQKPFSLDTLRATLQAAETEPIPHS